MSESQFQDFDLVIGGRRQDGYELTARSQGDDRRGCLRLTLDDGGLQRQLLELHIVLLQAAGRTRRATAAGSPVVQAVGRRLFDAVFSPGVRALYERSQRQAAEREQRVRLRLHVEPPELSALPWEFLYDAERGHYLCLSGNTPLVRFIPAAHPATPSAVAGPLRILGVVAGPPGEPKLDVEREQQHVQQALAGLSSRGQVELSWLTDATWRELQSRLRRETWHAIHFIGHGHFDEAAREGTIVLNGEEPNEAHPLTASKLADLLLSSPTVRFVLLNTCQGAQASQEDAFSSTAALLVRRGIPAVLAMQYEISDRAAIEFSRSFYEALADGVPVDQAVSDARLAVQTALTDSVEWGTPALFTNSSDGLLFSITRSVPPKAGAAFDVFLSYNSRDRAAVRQVSRALQQRGLRPWLDEEQLQPGLPWQQELERIIRTCRSAAVCVGAHGLGPWEDTEMRALLNRFVQDKQPVIPLLLPEAPQQVNLPMFLQAFTYVDLRDGLTANGLDRLAWGITGQKKPAPPPEPGEAESPPPLPEVAGEAGPERAPPGGHDTAQASDHATVPQSPAPTWIEDEWNRPDCPVRLLIAVGDPQTCRRLTQMRSALTKEQPIFETKQSFRFAWEEAQPAQIPAVLTRILRDRSAGGENLIVVVSDRLTLAEEQGERRYIPLPVVGQIRTLLLEQPKLCGLVAIVDGPACRTQDIDSVVAAADLTAPSLRAAIVAVADGLRLKAPPGPGGELGPRQALLVRLAHNEQELLDCLALRFKIYQRLGYLSDSLSRCPKRIEMDSYDLRSLHFIAQETQNGNIVGTVRLVLPRGISPSILQSTIGGPPAETLQHQVRMCRGIAEAAQREGCDVLADRLAASNFASLPILQSNDFREKSAEMLGRAAGLAELSRLIVSPAYRGLGVSRLLVRAVIVVAADLGCQSLMLECIPGHVGMYEKQGFERLQGHHGRDQDLDQVAVAMTLDLSGNPLAQVAAMAQRDRAMIDSQPADPDQLWGRRHLCLCNDKTCWVKGAYSSRAKTSCPLNRLHAPLDRIGDPRR